MKQRYKELKSKVSEEKLNLSSAVKLLKECSNAKFDESIEFHIKTNVTWWGSIFLFADVCKPIFWKHIENILKMNLLIIFWKHIENQKSYDISRKILFSKILGIYEVP